jgi:hypothetical protein
VKAFKRKPEQIVAERFDGTPESAKKIVEWMKATEGEKVVYYNLQLSEEQYALGGNRILNDPVSPPELQVHTNKARFYLTPGNWMIRTEEGEFKTSYDDFLAKHYDEI